MTNKTTVAMYQNTNGETSEKNKLNYAIMKLWDLKWNNLETTVYGRNCSKNLLWGKKQNVSKYRTVVSNFIEKIFTKIRINTSFDDIIDLSMNRKHLLAAIKLINRYPRPTNFTRPIKKCFHFSLVIRPYLGVDNDCYCCIYDHCLLK